MSERYYSRCLEETQTELENALEFEPGIKKLFPEKQRNELHEKVTLQYLRYCKIARRLDKVYANICQPQKRRLVRNTLDSVLARALELRHEMVSLAFSETPCLFELCFLMRWDPEQIGLPVPHYFETEKPPAHVRTLEMVQEIFDKIGRVPNQDDLYMMSIEEAVRLIQIHERARQGRVRSQLMLQIRRKGEKSQQNPVMTKQTSEEKAATRIQAVWRSFKVRRLVKTLRDDEMILLGMKRLEEFDLVWNPKVVPILSERTEVRKNERERFEAALIATRLKLAESEEQKMKEGFELQLREYFQKYFELTGKLPEIPKEEEGGSSAMDFNYFPSKDDDESKTNKKSPLYAAVPKAGKKKGKKKSKKKSGKDEGQGEQDENQKKMLQLQPSKNLEDTVKSQKEYQDCWATPEIRTRSFEDPRYDALLLEEEKRKEVEEEARRIVDGKMRKELDNLKAALDRDFGRKRPRKVVRLRRGGRKSKKKREKDLTPDRTLESLVEELATYGIIKPPKDIRLADLIGEFSFVLPKEGAMASFGDIIQAFTEICIIPLGSQELHSRSPFTRSLILAGPRGAGKASLVHALCREVGAVLFDISPQNLAGKYPGKAGLAMLFHLVHKVSRLVQPSIILIEEIDKIFKKPTKGDRGSESGKRMKKDLPKLIKSITSEERIMVLSTTSQPWECDQKALFATSQRCLIAGLPDYSNRFKIWTEKIRRITTPRKYILGPEADLTTLARLTDGYSAGSIVRCINQTLSDRRLSKLPHHPIKASEFIPELSKIEPVYKEDLDALVAWSQKTPLAKRAQKLAKAEEEKLKEAQKPVEENKKKKEKSKKKKDNKK